MRSLAVACLMMVGCGTQPAHPGGGGGTDSDAGSGGGGGSAGGGSSGGSGGGLGGGNGGAAGGSGVGGGSAGSDGGIIDLDRDGLDDAWEDMIARSYLPVLAGHPQDACALGGIAYRVRKHPSNPALLNIIYDHLYQDDCGTNGHVGDNEAFAITVNPAKPAPLGITALKAISHQNTPCQKITECGTCGSLSPCGLQPDGGLRPLLYASKDKHGNYASVAVCYNILSCFDVCTPAEKAGIPMVNVGEPDAHFTENLSADGGFINAANGWTKTQLYDHNPWDPTKNFGSAGNVAGDFLDPAFVAAACN